MIVKPYKLGVEDLSSGPFGHILRKSTKYQNLKIENLRILYQRESDLNVLAHYEEVFDSGDRFLRIATR